jgi:hypothetical protein
LAALEEELSNFLEKGEIMSNLIVLTFNDTEQAGQAFKAI